MNDILKISEVCKDLTNISNINEQNLCSYTDKLYNEIIQISYSKTLNLHQIGDAKNSIYLKYFETIDKYILFETNIHNNIINTRIYTVVNNDNIIGGGNTLLRPSKELLKNLITSDILTIEFSDNGMTKFEDAEKPVRKKNNMSMINSNLITVFNNDNNTYMNFKNALKLHLTEYILYLNMKLITKILNGLKNIINKIYKMGLLHPHQLKIQL